MMGRKYSIGNVYMVTDKDEYKDFNVQTAEECVHDVELALFGWPKFRCSHPGGGSKDRGTTRGGRVSAVASGEGDEESCPTAVAASLTGQEGCDVAST